MNGSEYEIPYYANKVFSILSKRLDLVVTFTEVHTAEQLTLTPLRFLFFVENGNFSSGYL